MPKNVFAGVGMSKADDAFTAGKEAVEMAMNEMRKQGGKKPTFGLIFCSGGKYGKDDKTIQRLVDGAHSVFGETPWVGCTTAGEISSYGVTKASCVAMIISSDYIRVSIGIGENVSKKPQNAGFVAAKTAIDNLKTDRYIDSYLQYLRAKKRAPAELVKMNPFSLLLLGKGPEKGLIPSIPKSYDNDAVLEGVMSAAGTEISIVGGVSADDWLLEKNYHFVNGRTYNNAIVIVAFFTHVYSSSGLAHGFKPTKKIAFLDQTEGDFVKKINGKPAPEAYAELTGIPLKKLKAEPLLVCSKYPFGLPDPFGEYWTRLPIKVVFGNLYVAPKVQQNSVLHIMESKKEDVLNSAKGAMTKAIKVIGKKKVIAALVFTCAIRDKTLGKDSKKELEILQRFVGKIPIIGFHTFGEFGGVKGRKMGSHALTSTVWIITDELMV